MKPSKVRIVPLTLDRLDYCWQTLSSDFLTKNGAVDRMTENMPNEKHKSQDERFVTKLTPKTTDFSKWYTEIIRKAELADYAPMKGMMVIRPYGFAVWENIQRLLDQRIKQTGHSNAYFPLFIPESFLEKETEHLEGFSPEVAWVTHGGRDELEERLAVRPTSEAIIGNMYAKWINSWRDLPVLINQWANIVRWEKVTRPFLRTTEFLWQEGHTAHETEAEALEETLMILSLYKEFVETEMAIPVLAGKKSGKEKFAGALETYAIEGLMSDGKALQMGTSHHLGQQFSKVFNIRFEDRNQKLQYAWQTSWGVSTRLVGAVIMAHGDDSGLVLPPRIAPLQAIIIPISVGNWKQEVLPVAQDIQGRLEQSGVRVRVDEREEFTPGWKFSEWEMRGVPLRVEIGPRDIKGDQVLLVRRDTSEKDAVPMTELEKSVNTKLEMIQKNMFDRALTFQRENTRSVQDFEQFKATIETKKGFIKTFWCGSEACEEKIKEETLATIRIIVMEEDKADASGKCILCEKSAQNLVYFARAY